MPCELTIGYNPLGALKATLQLSQEDLDTIATLPYVSGLFAWLPGMLSDRRGPRAAVTMGACGQVGFGRIVSSEMEAPDISANWYEADER